MRRLLLLSRVYQTGKMYKYQPVLPIVPSDETGSGTAENALHLQKVDERGRCGDGLSEFIKAVRNLSFTAEEQALIKQITL